MKLNFRLSFLSGIALLALFSQTAKAYRQFNCAGSLIRVVDSAEAAVLNLQSDNYTRSLTDFDLAVRLNRANGGTEADYLQLSAKSVESWNGDEEELLKAAFDAIEAVSKKQSVSLHLPDTVILIRTNASEEFHADGWTRRNRIMLNMHVTGVTTALVAHELWHVISRLNPEVRDRAYSVFHFVPCNNVDYKTPFKNQVITNPDCPEIRHYIRVDQNGIETDMALMIRAASGFQPNGSLGDYVDMVLVTLDGDDNNKHVRMKNGKPVFENPYQLPDFFKQVGQNTEYMLHVEEITAEHFAALMTGRKVRQPEYITALQNALKT